MHWEFNHSKPHFPRVMVTSPLPITFPIQFLIASRLETPALSFFSKTAIPPVPVIYEVIYPPTSRDHLSCGDSILGAIKPMQLPDRESGSVSILAHSRHLMTEQVDIISRFTEAQTWKKSSVSEMYKPSHWAWVFQTTSAWKENNAEENEP